MAPVLRKGTRVEIIEATGEFRGVIYRLSNPGHVGKRGVIADTGAESGVLRIVLDDGTELTGPGWYWRRLRPDEEAAG